MLHGDVIPVSRRYVENGEISFNGDIVLMSGETDIWPDPDYPLTQDDLDYEAYCLKQASILKTRERRRCYTCGESGIGRMRHVTGHFVTSKHFDPTEAYRLDCGHSTIDC